MKRYAVKTVEKARSLRFQGKTYTEITRLLNYKIPKGTLSYWCRDIDLPKSYHQKIRRLNLEHLRRARVQAVVAVRSKRIQYLNQLDVSNKPVVEKINDFGTAKIALAMLCLGEASKYSGGAKAFTLGNSDPKVITIFLTLLKICFDFKADKIRCTVQCRADQNTRELEKYWQKITQIPQKYFYKTRIDPRTLGKPTKNVNYKGVCRIDYLDTKVQLELESLAELVYNKLISRARSLAG